MTDQHRPSPLVVLGFDAMAPALAHQMMDAGRLPNFAGMMRESATAAVRTPPGLVVGGIWPSFWSGQWPSEHGFYCFRQLENGTYRVRRFTPDDIVAPPFWTTLAEAGRTVCVLDLPLTSQTRPEHGVHVIDWGTHDRFFGRSFWPPTVEAEIRDLVGEYPLSGRCDPYGQRAAWSDLCRDLRRGIEQRTDVSLHFLAREHWDCFAVVFSESHCAGHQLWFAHDPSHPRYSEDLDDPLARIYEALDDALGRILAALPADATVMTLLSHGMAPHHDGEHLLAELLGRLDDACGPPSRWLVGRERVLSGIDRRRAPKTHAGGGTQRAQSVDSSRRFFKVPNNEHTGAVRINLSGREPRGRVAPGAELESMLTWLERELCALRNPETGGPVVRRVRRTSALYSGSRLDALPDLLIDWERGAPINGVASEMVGEIRHPYTGTRSADHRDGGLLLVRGPGVEAGPIAAISIVDVAPTILEHAGVRGGPFDGAPVPALTAPQR